MTEKLNINNSDICNTVNIKILHKNKCQVKSQVHHFTRRLARVIRRRCVGSTQGLSSVMYVDGCGGGERLM